MKIENPIFFIRRGVLACMMKNMGFSYITRKFFFKNMRRNFIRSIQPVQLLPDHYDS